MKFQLSLINEEEPKCQFKEGLSSLIKKSIMKLCQIVNDRTPVGLRSEHLEERLYGNVLDDKQDRALPPRSAILMRSETNVMLCLPGLCIVGLFTGRPLNSSLLKRPIDRLGSSLKQLLSLKTVDRTWAT